MGAEQAGQPEGSGIVKLDGLEILAVVVKSAGAGVLAAFNLSWPVLIGSLLGATASFHFDRAGRPKSWQGVLYAIAAMAFAGIVGSQYLPMLMESTAGVEPWARAAGVSLFANIGYAFVRRLIDARAKAAEGS